MDTLYTPFMRDLEARFKKTTALPNRSAYKIFYCQVRPARILTLGINPGGEPANTKPDGRTHMNGVVAAASAAFYEYDEHDILDCEWRENFALRKVLLPLVGGELGRIRAEVVKTNLAFHRSARVSGINIETAANQTTPFLTELIEVVKPRLVLLTGVSLDKFTARFARDVMVLEAPQRDPGVGHVVFAASLVTLRCSAIQVLAVQLAHASQFGWTYGKYNVAQRILDLLQKTVYPAE